MNNFSRSKRRTSVALLLAVLAALGLSAADGLAAVSPLRATALLRHPAGRTARPVVRSSVPAPGIASNLYGVTCLSASRCWAVGAYATGAGAILNQALRWNGSKWSRVRTPDPGGTGKN